jgi:predicted dehydrogenase
MRFVISGLGWWGRSWTDVLKMHPNAQIVATVDPAPDARDWSMKNLGVAHFPDLDRAFQDIDAEAVLVTTPPKFHSPVLIKAVEHGNMFSWKSRSRLRLKRLLGLLPPSKRAAQR